MWVKRKLILNTMLYLALSSDLVSVRHRIGDDRFGLVRSRSGLA